MGTQGVLGVPLRVLAVAASLMVAAEPAAAQQQVEKLVPADGLPGADFGTAVSACGDRALIGASGVLWSVGNCAYVFERANTGAWTQVAKLEPSVGEVISFGASVSLSGDIAVVGAPSTFTSSIDSGSAHVFERQAGGDWIEVEGLYPPLDFFSYFGTSVAVSGDQLAVGAPGSGKLSLSGGSMRVYERNPDGDWIEVFYMDSLTPKDYLGLSVSISGKFAVVGAPGDDDPLDSGAARVIARRPSGTWFWTASLRADDAAPGDAFGSAVSISGQRLVVGAPEDDDHGPASGSAYVFELQGAEGWVQTAKLTAMEGAREERFGSSLSLLGDRLLVAAPGDDGVGADCGSVHVFERWADGTWHVIAQLDARDGAPGDAFGVSVSLDRDHALVGAPGDEGIGSAYVFDFP